MTIYRNLLLFVLSIVHHFEGQATVFSTFYVNGHDNLPHMIEYVLIDEVNTWKWMKTIGRVRIILQTPLLLVPFENTKYLMLYFWRYVLKVSVFEIQFCQHDFRHNKEIYQPCGYLLMSPFSSGITSVLLCSWNIDLFSTKRIGLQQFSSWFTLGLWSKIGNKIHYYMTMIINQSTLCLFRSSKYGTFAHLHWIFPIYWK